MILNIKEVKNNDTEKRILNELSGDCLLALLEKRLFKPLKVDLPDDEIINYDFINYDYDKRTREPNEKYVEWINNYIERLNNRQ